MGEQDTLQLTALHGVNVNKHDVAVAQEVERCALERDASHCLVQMRVNAGWWSVKEVVSSRLAVMPPSGCPKAAVATCVDVV